MHSDLTLGRLKYYFSLFFFGSFAKFDFFVLLRRISYYFPKETPNSKDDFGLVVGGFSIFLLLYCENVNVGFPYQPFLSFFGVSFLYLSFFRIFLYINLSFSTYISPIILSFFTLYFYFQRFCSGYMTPFMTILRLVGIHFIYSHNLIF